MNKSLKLLSAAALLIGIVLIGGGSWGIYFTYHSIAQENIITTPDSAVPQKPVRGPLTLKAQADVIRKHTLAATEGKTFAEMPYEVPKLDANKKPMVDASGKALMVPNTARDIWITATTLRTALNMAILAYALSGLSVLIGLIMITTGATLCALMRQKNGQHRV